MSLKAFHIFFICLASIMSLGVGLWSLNGSGAADAPAWMRWFGIGMLAIAASLMIYGRSFVKKMKGVSYL
jgi:hypothetical protein